MPTTKKPKLSSAISKNAFYRAFLKIDEAIKYLNTNTLFIGLMMFTMQIVSRFVTIKLSRSMEGYMKFSFSKDILVFTIAFIGTRNLYWSLAITIVFIICMDYLFNEESSFCCLSENFTTKHIKLLDESMDASGNHFGAGMGMGVSDSKSSIPGAPGLGFSVGAENKNANNMIDIRMDEMDLDVELFMPKTGLEGVVNPNAKVINPNTNIVNQNAKNTNEIPFSPAYSSYR